MNKQDLVDKADIREFKLINGETIIGEVVGLSEGFIIINEPYTLMHNHGGVIMFRRWFYSSETNTKYVPQACVITFDKCCTLVKERYISSLMEDVTLDALDEDDELYEFYSEALANETIH